MQIDGRCAELQWHHLQLKMAAHPLFMFAITPRFRILKMRVQG